MNIIITYILISIFSVYSADILLFALDKNEMPLFKKWNKILFQLKLKNSIWKNPLGACEVCFTVWYSQIIIMAISMYLMLIDGFSGSDVFILLIIFLLNFGAIGFFISIKNILNKKSNGTNI